MRGVRMVTAATLGVLLPLAVHAATYDVQIQRSDVTFRPERFFVGDLIRVYATVKNVGDRDVQGNVFFSENGTAIGTPPPFSVRARGAEEEVWVDWQPATLGERQIFIRVVTAPETRDEVTTNNEMIVSVFVDRDTDGDGIGDRDDPPQPVASPVSSGGTGSVPPATPSGAAPLSAPAPAAAPRIAPTASPSVMPARRAPPVGTPPTTSATATVEQPVRAVPIGPPAPEEVITTPTRAVPARTPYDAQLRELLGNAARPWRSVRPWVAIAVGALAATTMTVLLRRRRFSRDHDADVTSSENVGRRPPRAS